jgi:glycosyltransferase involved in cell wall biosynthesis
MPHRPDHLLIVSHVVHYQRGNELFAYAPYAREIEIWADLFSKVTIAAPCRRMEPPGDAAPLARANISIRPQRETGGETARAKLAALLHLPGVVWTLGQAMRRADAIHVRCPGNLGLLGGILAPLFSRFLVAKYAGQWSGYSEEAWSVRLQRAILRSRWWRGPVTVYGDWPNQPAHVVPFFTSVLTDAQLKAAQRSAARTRTSNPLNVLYVGRLSAAKHVDALIAAVGALHREQIRVHCRIVGAGPERQALEAQSARCTPAGAVTFVGAVSFDRVLDFYADSDVLVLASESEGWPKAIAEAMAFGLVCIGSDRGLIPRMLDDGRGMVVPVADVAALARALGDVARRPAAYQAMRARAAAWAQRYSLEGLRGAIRDLLRTRWNVPLDMRETSTQIHLQELPS